MLPPHTAANASASTSSSCGRKRRSSWAATGAASGASISRRQRDRIVGSNRPGLWLTSSSNARSGGSSRILKTAFAALRFISSAPSTMTTRQPSSAAVSRKNSAIARVSSTTISPRNRRRRGSQARSTVNRSAWPPAAMRRNTPLSGSTARPVSTGAPRKSAAGGAVLSALRQQKAGKAKGQGRLADAARPAKQDRVRQPSGAVETLELALGALVADEIRVRPRRQSRARAASAGGSTARAIEVAAWRSTRGRCRCMRLLQAPSVTPSRCATASSTARCTASGGPRGVDQHAAAGFGGGDLAEALAQPLVKGRIEALEAVGRRRPGGGAGEPDRDRQIEDQGQIRRKIAERKPMQHRDLRRRQTPPVALIGERRIGKAVGHDPGSVRTEPARSASQTWSRRAAISSSASLCASQRSPSPSSNSRRIASAPGDPPGSRVANDRDPGVFECRDQKRHLRRFAGPLAALDGDEPAARHPAQCRWPQTR